MNINPGDKSTLSASRNKYKVFNLRPGIEFEVRRDDYTGWKAIFRYLEDGGDGRTSAQEMARRFSVFLNREQDRREWWLNDRELSEKVRLTMQKDCDVLDAMVQEVFKWQKRIDESVCLDFKVSHYAHCKYLRVDFVFMSTKGILERTEFCVSDYNTAEEALADMEDAYAHIKSLYKIEKEECNG